MELCSRSGRYTHVARMTLAKVACEMTGKRLMLVALGASLLGCAAQPPSTKIPQQMRTAEAICGNVIRLQQNQLDYQACVESLAASGGARRIGALASDGRMAAPFALPADGDTDSYFTASAAVRRVREERACSLLGLGNDVEAFVRCVVTLDMNLFIATHSAP